MVHAIFRFCQDFLVWLAAATGTTYEEINVIIFCVIWPLLTIALVTVCLVQRARVIGLSREMKNMNAETGVRATREES
jgi:hypothetical protein